MTLKPQLAALIILLVSLASIFYHILILSGIIPMEMTWGGKITDFKELIWMELISILVNLAIVAFILGYLEILPIRLSANRYRILFLALFMLFALNTVGNLLSDSELEKVIFTPITALLAWMFFQLSRVKLPKNQF